MKTLSDCREAGPVNLNAHLRQYNGRECQVREYGRDNRQWPNRIDGVILAQLNKLMINTTQDGWRVCWCREVRGICFVNDKPIIDLHPGVYLREDLHG